MATMLDSYLSQAPLSDLSVLDMTIMFGSGMVATSKCLMSSIQKKTHESNTVANLKRLGKN